MPHGREPVECVRSALPTPMRIEIAAAGNAAAPPSSTRSDTFSLLPNLRLSTFRRTIPVAGVGRRREDSQYCKGMA